ncbi:MAG: hypothetical protein IOD12_17795 [Silvanigrellales bacterium]|nr:hypothetical protein [Silvanigrellales bacterium]
MNSLLSLRSLAFASSPGLLFVFLSCGDATSATSQPEDAGVSRGTPASTASQAQATRVLAPWQKEALDAHNAARAKESSGLQALAWNAGLGAFAQAWADELKTKGCAPAHRPAHARTFEGKRVGENIYWQSRGGFGEVGSFGADGTQVSNAWASEKPSWNFASKSCAPGAVCGHYTQMVWKTTTTLGCGRAACEASEVWVCNYLAAGNYVGENPY